MGPIHRLALLVLTAAVGTAIFEPWLALKVGAVVILAVWAVSVVSVSWES